MSEAQSSPRVSIDETTPLLATGVSVDPAPPVAATVAPEPQAAHEAQPKSAEDLKHKECPGCKTTGARNLVVCIDGTSNQFSTKNTNVVELYSRLVKDEHQLTFYNSGIGTYAKPSWKSWSYRKQVIANTLDLAFALRFEKIIISAYAWLVDNFQPGDRIFLFGFSRGAYQVRALAAMIQIVGLLHKGNTDQIPFAYELYAASGDNKKTLKAEGPSKAWRDVQPLRAKISHAWKTRSSKGDDSLPSFPWPAAPAHARNASPVEDGITMQEQFKKTFSREGVRVHFVGAWDTVSSVGFLRDKTLPSTTDGMQSTCFFRHALALHEFRVKFLPEYVNGGAGPSRRSAGNVLGVPHTKEVWFTGSHSDIGGGSSTNTSLDKFGPALRWMSWEATSAGLRLVQTPDNWEPISVSQSMTNIWRIVECLPIKRLSYPVYEWGDNLSEGSSFTWLPQFFANRQIQPWQSIHQSVYEECRKFATPAGVMIEADAYLVLPPQPEVLRRGWIYTDERITSLRQLTSSRDGIHSLNLLNTSQYIYDFARTCRAKPDGTAKILTDLRLLNDAYRGSFLSEEGEDLPHTTNVTEDLSGTFLLHMCGHTSGVSSVAFLSDTRVISGSWDRTLRIWDVSTGETTLGSPLSGHRDDINCVAVHAATGLVASASDDSTIRLWKSDSNRAVHAGKVLQEEGMWFVLAVAFSPDGSHIVSGSADRAIRVWNAAAGKRVGEPVRGHTDCVRSVAFSSVGKQIVSGSDDCSVQLWEWSSDEGTLQPCGEPLEGHAGLVSSVAFSPDASVIASGSWDRTVRLWDAGTRTSKFTLEGHTDWVKSIAFAPSGTHVVSGSDDWTVRIWDARSSAAVRVLRGHTDVVMSVVFSPDGTRIASGSFDKTVRVWDFAADPDESHRDEDAHAGPAQIESA